MVAWLSVCLSRYSYQEVKDQENDGDQVGVEIASGVRYWSLARTEDGAGGAENTVLLRFMRRLGIRELMNMRY